MQSKKERRKRIIILIMVFVISFSTTATAIYAASHSGHYKLNPLVSMGLIRKNVHWWYKKGGSYDYSYRIQRGANAWQNAIGTDCKFTKVSNQSAAEIHVYSYNYGNVGWVGYHVPWINYGEIKLNEWYHTSGSGFTKYEEVFAHEMGHAFGLFHYSCNSELMRAQGYIGTPNPQEGDIKGYRAKYGL